MVIYTFPSRPKTKKTHVEQSYGGGSERLLSQTFLSQFESKVYRQTEVGPIGLRLSMAVSRIVMAMWDKQLAQLGAESEWIIHLLKLYVDDVTAIVETLKLG